VQRPASMLRQRGINRVCRGGAATSEAAEAERPWARRGVALASEQVGAAPQLVSRLRERSC